MPATYALVPGVSVGPFLLGDSLWHILDILRTEKRAYPKVELAWDTSKAHESDITLSLPNLILYFPSPGQLLAHLEVRNIPSSTLTLSYEGQVLRSQTQALTRGLVGRILGPTYSGEGGVLSYPGIKLSASSKTGNSSREDQVESITIVPKEEGILPQVVTLTKVVVHPNKGVTILNPHPVDILIGETTAQDVLLDLGSPLRKFVKQDDRMERIWGGENGSSEENKGIFWNYFQLGLDILISPDNLVSKIILHSNIPGTPAFQTHARCPWQLQTPSGSLNHTSPLSSFKSYFSGEIPPDKGGVGLKVPEPVSKKKSKKGSSGPSSMNDNGDIHERINGGEIVGAGKKEESEGMILDRVVEGGLDGIEGLSPSRLTGFKGLILEEDMASGGISSVLIFRQT